MQLFTDRARAADPLFVASATDLKTVAAICTRLDRIPLAIELAAPWVRLFTPAEMLSRLTHRFDLLAGDRLDLPSRQQSMRATVEWSCQLLPVPQQALFRRLGVFEGTFTVDAAEQVAARHR